MNIREINALADRVNSLVEGLHVEGEENNFMIALTKEEKFVIGYALRFLANDMDRMGILPNA